MEEGKKSRWPVRTTHGPVGGTKKSKAIRVWPPTTACIPVPNSWRRRHVKKKREANGWSLPPRPGCQTAGSRAPTTPPPLAWLLIPESWVSDSSCQTQPVERAASSAGPNVLTVTFLFRSSLVWKHKSQFSRIPEEIQFSNSLPFCRPPSLLLPHGIL